MFELGERVVCVEEVYHFQDEPQWPRRGATYTVRGHVQCHDGSPCIRLAEVLNPPRDYSKDGFVERAWPCRHFRPLREQTTDISIFTALLRERRRQIA